MRKWFPTALIAAMVISAMASVAWFALTPAEPVYQGKLLSAWLHEFDDLPSPGAFTPTRRKLVSDAREAIRHIGTNGIPLLLDRLRPDPDLKIKIIDLARKKHWIKSDYYNTVFNRNTEARAAFAELGASASNAVPELIRMYPRSHHPFTQASILDSLAHMGPAARSAIPLMLQVTATNTDKLVWERGLSALGTIHAEPEIVVPVLRKLLHDSRTRARYIAAEDLGEFGADGRVATADLLELIKDGDPSVSATALKALGRIYAMQESDNQWNHLVWSAKRNGYQPVVLITAINDLGTLGTNATPAVPALTKFLNDPDEGIRTSAAAALKKISPDKDAITFK